MQEGCGMCQDYFLVNMNGDSSIPVGARDDVFPRPCTEHSVSPAGNGDGRDSRTRPMELSIINLKFPGTGQGPWSHPSHVVLLYPCAILLIMAHTMAHLLQ